MLTMTAAAASYLSAVLERSSTPEATAVRFEIEGTLDLQPTSEGDKLVLVH
ncbi:MAG: hypothetical protein ACREU4_09740 [Burkholderiales bacterium]